MTKTHNSLFRQKAIEELLKEHLVSDQNQLVELLREYYQLESNQAMISRDLRKLGVIKKLQNGIMAYEVPTINVQIEILKIALTEIIHNESMIVIKTQPGLAAFVGDFLDQQEDLNILGCIAGENVVFVSPASVKEIKKTYKDICKKFQFKKSENKEK